MKRRGEPLRLRVITVDGQVVYAATDHIRFDREAVKAKYTSHPSVKFTTTFRPYRGGAL